LDVSSVLENFSLATFAEHIGDGFQLEMTGTDPVSLSLTQAKPLGGEAGSPAVGRAPFSLEFSGPETPVFPQATYRFRHATIGEFDMFIVPLGPADGGMRYEAIFT
jgi:hypothetical protein